NYPCKLCCCARDHDSRLSSVVLDHRIDNPVLLQKDFLHRCRLSIAELDHALACRIEKGPATIGDEAIECESVPTAIQRCYRIKVAHLGLKGSNLSRGNVGRVADDQVESTIVFKRCEGVAVQKLEAIDDAAGLGV